MKKAILAWYILPETCFPSLKFQVIKSVTINPSRAIGRHSEIGTLDIGREADITVFAREDDLGHVGRDVFGASRILEQSVVPKAVFRAGRRCPIITTQEQQRDD